MSTQTLSGKVKKVLIPQTLLWILVSWLKESSPDTSLTLLVYILTWHPGRCSLGRFGEVKCCSLCVRKMFDILFWKGRWEKRTGMKSPPQFYSQVNFGKNVEDLKTYSLQTMLVWISLGKISWIPVWRLGLWYKSHAFQDHNLCYELLKLF